MLRQLLLWGLILVFFASCETVVDLRVDGYQPTLAVSGIFTSNSNNPFDLDNTFAIQISETNLVSKPEEHSVIPDAIVELYQEGYLLEVLTYDSASDLYRSIETTAEQGEVYTLKVQHTDYPTLYAQSLIPTATAIGSTTPLTRKSVPSPFYPNVNLEKILLEIEIDDPAEQRNYYHILFYHSLVDFTVQGLDTIVQTPSSDNMFLSNFDMEGENENDAILSNDSQSVYGAYIHDESFNGTSPKLQFTIQFPFNPATQKAENIFVEVRTVPKSYYDFYTSLIQNLDTGANPLSSTPTSVKGNIENGRGIFAGYAQQIKVIRLP